MFILRPSNVQWCTTSVANTAAHTGILMLIKADIRSAFWEHIRNSVFPLSLTVTPTSSALTYEESKVFTTFYPIE